jgi:DNA polymerase/3'-5' exonuclease PolX
MVREQHLMCQLKGVGIRSKQKCLRQKEERNKVSQKIPLLPVLDDILKIQEVLLYKDERNREHVWDYSSRYVGTS